MMTHASLDDVCGQIADVGYAVLPAFLTPELLGRVQLEYAELYRRMREAHDGKPLETSHSGKGHFQIQPPLNGVFADPEVFANPFVIDCVRSILGAEARLAYYNSNISEPGSNFQDIHRDVRLLFGSEISLPTPSFMLVVNILLCDFTEANGSTEIWPGTHVLPDRGKGEDLVARSASVASRRLNAPAGSFIVRDARLWHRGTPNESLESRSMISLVYKRKWFGFRHDKSLEVSQQILQSWPEDVQSLFLR
ncbi:phytanoyl-CoA dioxygenase family protein [Streptosporangium roseum]|uniref:phytanoyl-CoA dioxygenase family protein n=1 Tax=Streptosporangium roseum TaxID=2001 RepID=UPI003319BF0D